jgi:hypothetical protein
VPVPKCGGTAWRLFGIGNGTNYLAWVSGSDVWIQEVSKETHSRPKKPCRLDLGRYLPRKYLHSRRSAIHSDTEILSVERDSRGVLQVQVRDPIENQAFRFASDGKDWRAYTSDGVELSPRW